MFALVSSEKTQLPPGSVVRLPAIPRKTPGDGVSRRLPMNQQHWLFEAPFAQMAAHSVNQGNIANVETFIRFCYLQI